jgi:flagellin
MVALQTLKGVNSGLEKTQSEISTGKSVATAKDNAAVWAISKVMESDVTGFRAISDSLALGESTVAVAQQASETVTDLLIQMKEKIVAATGDNVDRDKLNNDVTALKEQIGSVVRAAQFNGLNLVDGVTASTDVLSSLDRSGGAVSASYITVDGEDLSTGGYAAKAAFTGTTGVAGASNDSFGFSLDPTGGTDSATVVISDPTYAAGDRINMRVGESDVSYTVTQADVDAGTTADIIAVGLKSAIEASGENITVNYDSGTPGTLVLTNGTIDNSDPLAPVANPNLNSLTVSGQFVNAGSGGLGAMAGIDVTTLVGAQAALGTIETLTQTAIDASAAFGSKAKQIESQADFVSKLTDSFKAGIGSMVDANMEEASARLQALQVQQQLGIQALSIANQAPQNVLSLFR